jgi:hypothetical protein
MKSKEERKQFVEEAYEAFAPRVVDPEVYDWRLKAIIDGAEYLGFCDVIQKQPFTAVYIDLVAPEDVVGAGFSKVCYPDRFDARYGRELALRKALAEIARRL